MRQTALSEKDWFVVSLSGNDRYIRPVADPIDIIAWLESRMDGLVLDLAVYARDYHARTGVVYKPLLDLAAELQAPLPDAPAGNFTPLRDSVVEVVRAANRAVTADYVLEQLLTHPLISRERDVRVRSRKISQALYTNKGGRLRSRKSDVGSVYLWGLAAWWDDEMDDFKLEYRLSS